MRWTPGGPSGNLEDRRGDSAPMGGGGGGMGGAGLGLLMGFVMRRFGLPGVLVLAALAFCLNRGGPTGGATGGAAAGRSATAAGEVQRGAVASTPAEDSLVQFMSFVLDDAQNTWTQALPRQAGQQYRDARLVLFREGVRTACGNAPSAVGPFYCPADEKVYVDLSFFDELRRRYGAPGDFAQAYVLAHEIGHHLQKVLGTEAQVRQRQGQRPSERNALSVRLELQADCYAGVWAYTTNQKRLLEAGDVEEALGAASAVGDDRIQQRAQGDVNPDSFTHGSAEQRMRWFRRGLESGDMRSCNTFEGAV